MKRFFFLVCIMLMGFVANTNASVTPTSPEWIVVIDGSDVWLINDGWPCTDYWEFDSRGNLVAHEIICP